MKAPTLAQLLVLHVLQNGKCAYCEKPWPCTPTLAIEKNLALAA